MKRHVCDACGYIYGPAEGGPDAGIQPQAALGDLVENRICPIRGAGKDDSSEVK